MTLSNIGLRKILRHSGHGLGAIVLVSYVSALLGALTGIAIDAADLDGVDTGSVSDQFNIVGQWGLVGLMTGGAVCLGVFASALLSTRFLSRLTRIFERASGALIVLAIQSGGWIALGTFLIVTDVADGIGETLFGNILVLVLVSVYAAVAMGVITGLLAVLALLIGVLGHVVTGFFSSSLSRGRSRPEQHDLARRADVPWSIRAAATLMPPGSGRRWRDDFTEARYDYEPDQHPKLLHDFLLHAPAATTWAWIATLQRRVPGAGDSPGRQR
ncbi:hypothetical protein [Actinomadura macra]|uniref:hypothetical protein n=1 Tax=Actinomadura macra TaxID=46164 RepID=UPI000830B5A3|nr:hypothetical protein [Actinomadura macra]